MDLVLSSGFLAFARHLGFLRAVEAEGVEVEAVCGTSSGALVGALWAAGHSAEALTEELNRPPIHMLALNARPWRGLFSLRRVVAHLKGMLPDSFEELERPFAVGVMAPGRQHRLVSSGRLVEAVVASCAIPKVFEPIWLADEPLADGGAVDRCGVEAWRVWRPDTGGIVHWVERTGGQDVDFDAQGLTVVRTPPSGANFFNLKNFADQIEEASQLTRQALR